MCSILGTFGVQEQDWNGSRKCNSRVHNIRKRYLVVSRRTTGLRVYGIVELFNIYMHRIDVYNTVPNITFLIF